MANLTLFNQIISRLDRSIFSKLVLNHQSDKHQKGYTSWTHLVTMLFCQFAKSQSVRDISNGMRSATGNLNHLGINKAPSKSTISYQNKHRSWKLFRDYYYELLQSLGQHADFKRVKFRIKSKILLLDATTISLCLSLFDWGQVQDSQGSCKIAHLTLIMMGICLHTSIQPMARPPIIKEDIPLKGSMIVADRFYNDFYLLNVWDSSKVFFVIRHKDNLQFTSIKENELADES